MPTYSYQCKKCEHVQEVFHSMSANPRVKCSECGGATVRLVGTGAGLVFKGSGFYETDYKRGNGNGANGKPSSGGESKSESKSEPSKSESSSGSKPAATDSSK